MGSKSEKARKKAIRQALFESQNGRCIYCNCRVTIGDILSSNDPYEWGQIDHVIPISRGGQDHNNLVMACAPCNGYKYANDLMVFLSSEWLAKRVELFKAVDYFYSICPPEKQYKQYTHKVFYYRAVMVLCYEYKRINNLPIIKPLAKNESWITDFWRNEHVIVTEYPEYYLIGVKVKD